MRRKWQSFNWGKRSKIFLLNAPVIQPFAKIDDRFTLANDQFEIDGSRIRIPKLGWVRMRETLRFMGKIISATVSRLADRWFVSITVETNETSLCEAGI